MCVNNDKFQAYADGLLNTAVRAAEAFLDYDQAAVDQIVEAVFRAAFDHRIELAQAAVDETGIGNLQHKIIKNSWAALRVYKDIISRKTVGIISQNQDLGISEIASPIGPILALTPINNPTCTVIFKALIALKTRNPLIFSPHGAAKKCSRAAIEILLNAALDAGAPDGVFQVIRKSGFQYLDAVMRHPSLKLIMATGTPELVQMARNSTKPTLGSGPGNVPVYVDKSADLSLAAHYIIRSKCFDNGCVCSSEQALIVTREVDRNLRPLFEKEGAYFCNQDEKKELMRFSYDILRHRMRPAVVGKSAQDIAQQAGLTIPADRKLLVMECDQIGKEYPCSQEILAPILSYFAVPDLDAAVQAVSAIERQGGAGHTLSLFCNDPEIINLFSRKTSAGRILINSPSTQGAIGGLYNFINPSLTLSCGTETGSLIVDNISVQHLLHIQRLARRRINHQWYSIPRENWFDESITAEHILQQYEWNY